MTINLLNEPDSKEKATIEQAVQVLSKNRLLNIDMIEPLRRGHARVLYFDEENVLILEENMNSHMLYAPNFQIGYQLLSQIESCEALCIHQKEYLDTGKELVQSDRYIECYAVASFEGKKLPVKEDIDFRTLDLSFLPIVLKHYKGAPEYEVSEILRKGHLFGAFKDDELVGFSGLHLEGSAGLLEVFPEYRKYGYGTQLVLYVNNYIIDQGNIPFAQVLIDNEKSLNLQRKLGAEISEETLFWIF